MIPNGIIVGKLLNLSLGVDGKNDTHYEIIIGKIPEIETEPVNADYYRGTYFIINLNEKTMEVFNQDVFGSDIDGVFNSMFDRERVVKWLNSIKNLDDFIGTNLSATETVAFSVTSEEEEKIQNNFKGE